MSAFTRLGSGLWDWEPFTQLAPGPQVLWMALYTTAEAKRIVPGLFHGSITAMAEAAHKPVDETRVYLDALLDADMVEYEIKLRVLRLTKLPDAGESPANGNVIRGWFRRFSTVPQCAVRDSHVTVIRWLMEEWSRENGKPISIAHEQAWSETFGRIAVPSPRKRGVRRLAESDTSTACQPSLFQASRVPAQLPETVSSAPLALPEASSVDNSDSLRKVNNSDSPETVSQTVSKPSGSGSGIGSGSGSPDLRGGAGGTEAQLDALFALLGEVCGGKWNAAPGTWERQMLVDQIARLGGLDFGVLAGWMRARFRMGNAQELLTTPGRLIAAAQAAQRWSEEQARKDERAADMSATLRAELAAIGLGAMVS